MMFRKSENEIQTSLAAPQEVHVTSTYNYIQGPGADWGHSDLTNRLDTLALGRQVRHDYDLEKQSGHLPPSSAASFVSGKSYASSIITNKTDLTRISEISPLPRKLATSAYRNVRWNAFSVYRKVFAITLCANVIVMVWQLFRLNQPSTDVKTIAPISATAASVNFCVAILMRNEHVVNMLFRIACSLPLSAPLAIRRRFAKVYSYGGVHSACGVSGTLWYILFTILVIFKYPRKEGIDIAIITSTAATLLLLVTILIFAHPTLRHKLHNQFEATHRFAGWSAVALLWVQTILLAISNANIKHQKLWTALITSVPFWCLIIITCLLAYPWIRLRSRVVRVEPLSKHATRLHFDYENHKPFHVVRLSDSPLKETHGFATIPNYSDDRKGYSIIVSNAGDFTNKIITNPPKRLWVKGVPSVGVMRVSLMFRKVLLIATGSGIGPCLSLLQAYPDHPLRLLWSAPSPTSTFGEGILQAIYRSDPNAVVVDTKKTGRPNLVALAYAMFIEGECEAVVCISNPVVTRKVVYGLETRGVPAYGPIFDS